MLRHTDDTNYVNMNKVIKPFGELIKILFDINFHYN